MVNFCCAWEGSSNVLMVSSLVSSRALWDFLLTNHVIERSKRKALVIIACNFLKHISL